MNSDLIQINRPTSRPSASHAHGAMPASSIIRRTQPYRVHIETFGCQMNEYDSELVRSLLKAAGFCFTDEKDQADIVLLNTCAIRENAHNKVYGHLARLQPLKRRRGIVVGVLGCMAQNLKEELFETKSIIDVLVGPDGYRRLPALLSQAIEARENGSRRRGLSVDLSEYETYNDILPERTEGVNGWIAVMRGCDNFCTFCVVPYTRGRERSRDPQGILREVEYLAAHGYKQITLLGQNVNSYRYENWDFARLLIAAADISGIERVRFTSPHPKDFPPALLDAVVDHPKICKHIHLPVQSGNDRILGLMDRTYTRTDYLRLVNDIRRRRSDIVLTTDIICGFCTETDDDFLDTYRLVEDVGYHLAYVFKYSERKHTIAARKFVDDVPEETKVDRVNRLSDRLKVISHDLNLKQIGRTVPVLVEGHAKKSLSQWMGKTDGGITVVWEKDGTAIQPGNLLPITITNVSATTLFGAPLAS